MTAEKRQENFGYAAWKAEKSARIASANTTGFFCNTSAIICAPCRIELADPGPEHCGLRVESSYTSKAAVSSKGVINTGKKGRCIDYVYDKGGEYANITITVK